MSKLKSIWTSLSGSVSSILPLFFAVCKPGGACAVACASPIASLFGISSASLAATPLMKSMYPLLLVISAVSFTVSYYKLYILPKYAKTNSSGCDTECGCETPKDLKQFKLSRVIFWIGLLASVFFFSYFEYQNYKANTAATTINKTEQSVNSNQTDTTESKEPCCSGDTKCE
jgi:hypothetical protein